MREQIDSSKHVSNMELKLCGVEYGHLSACRLMDITDLSLWRIKVQAFRMWIWVTVGLACSQQGLGEEESVRMGWQRGESGKDKEIEN